jgi:hypothetical protein
MCLRPGRHLVAIDLFEFWKIGVSETCHPADQSVLSRVAHGFELNCLPACFMGPLKTAPVVLLYLSFGLSEPDFGEAQTQVGRQRYQRMRAGFEPLPGPDDHHKAWDWWRSRTQRLGNWAELQHKIAVLNIGAYHSKRFNDWPLLASLPSSRVCLEWAQSVLFPEAEKGERMVICLRAAKYWGLGQNQRYGDALFAPPVTIGGHLKNSEIRDQVVTQAARFLGN